MKLDRVSRCSAATKFLNFCLLITLATFGDLSLIHTPNLGGLKLWVVTGSVNSTGQRSPGANQDVAWPRAYQDEGIRVIWLALLWYSTSLAVYKLDLRTCETECNRSKQTVVNTACSVIHPYVRHVQPNILALLVQPKTEGFKNGSPWKLQCSTVVSIRIPVVSTSANCFKEWPSLIWHSRIVHTYVPNEETGQTGSM